MAGARDDLACLMELLLAVARSLQQRRQPLRSPQALAILNHAHADGRRSRRSGQVPASQIARRHCLVTAGTRQPRVGVSRTAVRRSPSARRAAANPIARLAPPLAQAPGHLPRHPRQNEAPVLRATAVSDLDPDQSVPGPDRDRECLSQIARAAVLHTIAEQLPVCQQDGDIPHGCTGPSTPSTNARATRARAFAPHSSRSPEPPAWPSAHPPFPARLTAESPGRRTGTRGCTPDSPGHVKPEHAADAARPWPSVKQPMVRTDRLRAPTPSAIRPWTPRHSGPQRYKVTHDGTEKKRPA